MHCDQAWRRNMPPRHAQAQAGARRMQCALMQCERASAPRVRAAPAPGMRSPSVRAGLAPPSLEHAYARGRDVNACACVGRASSPGLRSPTDLRSPGPKGLRCHSLPLREAFLTFARPPPFPSLGLAPLLPCPISWVCVLKWCVCARECSRTASSSSLRASGAQRRCSSHLVSTRAR